MKYLRSMVFIPLMCTVLNSNATEVTSNPSVARSEKLIRMVRQDCGSCHGMRLTGGLGPSLVPEVIQGKPIETLTAIIYHGVIGTPMPGWKTMLTEADAQWIAENLLKGFPEEIKK
jgi:cytochrome c55X